MSRTYILNGAEKKFNEVKSFIDNYSKEIKTNSKGRYNIILTLIPSNTYVLDYGCGEGHCAYATAEPQRPNCRRQGRVRTIARAVQDRPLRPLPDARAQRRQE